MTNILDYAKYYAGRGWDVFPVKPRDKTPLLKWADEACKDEAKIQAWWTKNPNANVGIATGKRSNIVVLDVDAGHGGNESLAALVREHGSLPKTVTAHTGGGGRHIIFVHPGIDIHNSASKLGQGLDIRGDGGYIVAPPSIHPNGKAYTWAERPSLAPLADMPAWMIEKLTAVTPLEYPKGEQETPGAIASGSRNQVLTSLAGTMRRRGMSESAIYTALLTENQVKCVPPLDDKEVSLIAKSVMRYEPKAAPVMQNAQRLSIEWAFCKSILDFPEMVTEFLWIEPAQFSDPSLSRFWMAVQAGKNPAQAALDSGLLVEIDKAHSNPLDVDRYAEQIQKYSRIDRKVRAGAQIQKLAEMGDEERIDKIISEMAKETNQSGSIILQSTAEQLDAYRAILRDDRQFIKIGIGNFDAQIGGLERKKLSVLAARPSVGKTTLAWQVARNAAMNGYRVLFLSLEVSAISLWRKAALGVAEVSSVDVQNKKVPEATLQRIENEIIPELVRVYDGSMYVFDTPPFDLSRLERVILQAQPDLIICDHMGYVKHAAENEVHRLGEMMKWAKEICKRTNTHFMMIHQLNRNLENRERKEPQLADLRDSGKVEEDADVVIMPYRPAYHSDDKTVMRYNETIVYIRKNRDGALGAVGLYMDMLHQWFYRRDEIPPNYSSVRLGD